MGLHTQSMDAQNRGDAGSPCENGLVTVTQPGQTAPWLGPLGVCLIKVWGMRRRDGRVEFGVGDEQPPILDWVPADAFYTEWPQ